MHTHYCSSIKSFRAKRSLLARPLPLSIMSADAVRITRRAAHFIVSQMFSNSIFQLLTGNERIVLGNKVASFEERAFFYLIAKRAFNCQTPANFQNLCISQERTAYTTREICIILCSKVRNKCKLMNYIFHCLVSLIDR